tara:strand:+ start:11881 stop:12048 length:168 start_codon:yes stop_codon:yes gene_type:complete
MIDRPDTIFAPTAALEIAASLNSNVEDDWRYEVVLVGSKALVQVRDEDGEVVGNL